MVILYEFMNMKCNVVPIHLFEDDWIGSKQFHCQRTPCFHCNLSQLLITAVTVSLNPFTKAVKDVFSPWVTKTSHLPRGLRRARRTRPAVPHDTCPCSPASVACCSRPVTHSPLPAAPPAPALPRLLPTSGSR